VETIERRLRAADPHAAVERLEAAGLRGGSTR
jgi:hypothetical protein